MPTCHPLAGEPDIEGLWTCPYNASHRIAHKRIQFHLTKCRKGHPNAKKEVCPYNATHMVTEQEFKFHLETCPSKGIIDNFKYITPNENHIIELPPEPVVPPAEENWDNDYCQTYEPIARIAEAPLIHSFIGGTKSERKKCRVQQRQKFRALDEGVSSVQVKAEPKVVLKNDDDQPLRFPTSLPENFPNNSAEFATLNRLATSGVSNTAESAPKPQGVSGVLADARKAKIALMKYRTAQTGAASSENGPGPSQEGDDEFIRFMPKGRGKFRNF